MTQGNNRYSVDHRVQQTRLPTSGSTDASIIAKLNAGQPLLPGEQQYWQHRMQGGRGARTIPAAAMVGGGGQGGVNSDGWTLAQQQAAKHFTSGPQGSAVNPWVPTRPDQYARIPKGGHYVYTDGSVRVKQ
jgi:hypothetical protein